MRIKTKEVVQSPSGRRFIARVVAEDDTRISSCLTLEKTFDSLTDANVWVADMLQLLAPFSEPFDVLRKPNTK